MAHEWHYYSPNNRHWPLTKFNNKGVYIEEGGFPELVSTRQDSGLVVPGLPGQILLPDGQINPMTGTMTVVVDGPRVGLTNEEVFVAWNEDWDDVDEGTLVVEWTKPGHLSTKVRLAGDGMAGTPPYRLNEHEQDYFTFSMSIVADSGAWVWTQRETGPQVTIHNTGRSTIYPRLTWRYAGTVTMPSGMVLDLPAVDGPRTIDFEPRESNVVTDVDGNIDRATWSKLRGGFTEGVPRGAKRTYTIPTTAALTWDTSVRDAWR